MSPPIVAPRVRGCPRHLRLSSTKLHPTTSSSFVEEPTPRAHRQCRRRSPPTGGAREILFQTGRRRHHSTPSPETGPEGRRRRARRRPPPAAATPEAVTVASNAGPIRRSRTRRLPPSEGAVRASPPSPAGAMEVAGEEGSRPHGLLPERTRSRF